MDLDLESTLFSLYNKFYNIIPFCIIFKASLKGWPTLIKSLLLYLYCLGFEK